MYAKFVTFTLHVRGLAADASVRGPYVNNTRALVVRHCPMKMYFGMEKKKQRKYKNKNNMRVQ